MAAATQRFDLVGGEGRGRSETMAVEVRRGLERRPRSIPPKYFYDAEGSRLFDAICELPEYYLTRAEHALLVQHADAIVARTEASALCEIGSGMARKTGPLVQALCERSPNPLYVPFDIAPEALEASARELLASYPRLRARGIVGDFGCDLERFALGAPPSVGRRLFAFLGSTVGNLDEKEAPAMLRRIAKLMTGEDAFLLGADLVKDPRTLHAAYNDAAGLTAAFNRNVLRVLDRELGGNFDLDAFDHLALYDEGRERIEMHLVSKRPQAFELEAIGLRGKLAGGERILTEISRKFTPASLERTLHEGGMRLEELFVDADRAFALALARRPSAQ